MLQQELTCGGNTRRSEHATTSKKPCPDAVTPNVGSREHLTGVTQRKLPVLEQAIMEATQAYRVAEQPACMGIVGPSGNVTCHQQPTVTHIAKSAGIAIIGKRGVPQSSHVLPDT